MSTDHGAELLFFSRPSSSSNWAGESAVGFRAQFAFVSGR